MSADARTAAMTAYDEAVLSELGLAPMGRGDPRIAALATRLGRTPGGIYERHKNLRRAAKAPPALLAPTQTQVHMPFAGPLSDSSAAILDLAAAVRALAQAITERRP